MRKKIAIPLVVLIIIIVLNCGGSSVQFAKIDFGTSTRFSKEELNNAVGCIKKEFRTYKGCTLKTIVYCEEETKEQAQEWSEQYEVRPSNVAIFKSDFTTSSSSIEDGFNDNDLYSDWTWILVRENNKSDWRVVSAGY